MKDISTNLTFILLDALEQNHCASIKVDVASGGLLLQNRKRVESIQFTRPEGRILSKRFSKRITGVLEDNQPLFLVVSFLSRVGKVLCTKPVTILPQEASLKMESKAIEFATHPKWKPCPCFWVISDDDPFSMGPDEADIDIQSLSVVQTGVYSFDVSYMIECEPSWLPISKQWVVYHEDNVGDMVAVPITVNDNPGSKSGIATLAVSGPGNYEVALEVVAGSSCIRAEKGLEVEDEDDAEFKVLVSPSVITAIVDPCNHLKYTFKDSSVDSNGDWSPGISPIWQVKDSQGNVLSIGISLSPHTFTVTFPAQGPYVVSLNAIDPMGGQRPTAIYNVNIGNPSSVIDFTKKIDSCPLSNFTVTFTNTSTGLNGCPGAWHWNFGDGNTSNTASPQHVYANAGSYSVTLTFTSSSGQVSVRTKTVNVYHWEPKISYEVCPDGTVTFWTSDGWSWSDAIFGPQDVEKRRVWSFSGGNPKGVGWRSASKLKVCYKNPGTYTATLEASNLDDAICSVTVAVEVRRVTGGCCKKESAKIEFPYTHSGKDYRFKTKLKFNGKRKKVVGFVKTYRKVGMNAMFLRCRVHSIKCYVSGQIWYQAGGSSCLCTTQVGIASVNTMYSKKSICKRKFKTSKQFRVRKAGLTADANVKLDANHIYADTVTLPVNDCGCKDS